MNTKRILGTLAIAMVGGFISLLLHSVFYKEKVVYKENENVNKSFVSEIGARGEIDFTGAAESSIHAVVHVKTKYNMDYENPFYSFFFGDPAQGNAPVMASGSGVIISSDGYIVTNNHVIDKSNSIEVVLNDKRTFEAKLIGRDPATDIALLKIDATNLPTIPYGNSDIIKIGEWVLAVGNPFNLTSTVTAGIVSAKARNINILDKSYAIESFIQTDAAVNPGNSGGALVNIKGELVGINTAIASQTGSYAGYSFAIPVSIVQKVVNDLTEFGTVQRAFLGVEMQDIDDQFAKEKKLDKMEGIYVANVNDGGSAQAAGILAGDIILKVGNINVNKLAELKEQITKFRPGDKVMITLKRNGDLKEINVVLKNQQGTTSFVDRNASSLLGATFEPIGNNEKRVLGINHGVKVVSLTAGKFLKAGIKEGFIITYINRKQINDFEDIQAVVNSTKGGIYIEGIYPNGMTAYYAFGLK